MITKKRYFSWCVILIIVAISAVAVAQDRPAASVRNAKESDLIKVLKSDASKADKAIICKQLAIFGTEEAVPAIAPLLADKELTSWARIALEAIPGPAADAALRDAMDKVDGRILVGVINSIAVRRDGSAVDALIKKLGDSDGAVASAAAVALGHIGGEQAAKALVQSLSKAPADVRSYVAMGCVLAAEWFLANDKTAEAIELYDIVRKADVPTQRHLEAIRGAILARKSAGVPLLVEQLESQDKDRLGIGLRAARELTGSGVTEALAKELASLNPERQPLLLLAIADRKDSAVLPVVEKAAQSGTKDLRITAINILIEHGDITCIQILLKAVTEDDAQIKAAALDTLIRLPGKNVDADLVKRIPDAEGKLKQILIEIAGQRQIASSLPAVVACLENNDAGIRSEAARTIGIIGDDGQADDLVKLLMKTDSSNKEERAGIERALLSISGRCGEKCLPHIKPLTQSSNADLQMTGLHALAVVGGPVALGAVESAIKEAQSEVQNEAVRILSTWPNNWPEDDEAGKALLELLTSTEKMSHQVLGLRGYLQYVRVNKKLNNEQKVEKVQDVQSHVKRSQEKMQAIAVLGEAPCASALDLLTTLADDAAVAEEAFTAMVRIADRDIPGVSKDRRKEVLQTVIEKSKNNGTKQRARKALDGIR